MSIRGCFDLPLYVFSGNATSAFVVVLFSLLFSPSYLEKFSFGGRSWRCWSAWSVGSAAEVLWEALVLGLRIHFLLARVIGSAAGKFAWL